MFDMDPFGGKKVPCTKMPQKLEKLNNPILGLLRPRGVLNNPPLFLSLIYMLDHVYANIYRKYEIAGEQQLDTLIIRQSLAM